MIAKTAMATSALGPMRLSASHRIKYAQLRINADLRNQLVRERVAFIQLHRSSDHMIYGIAEKTPLFGAKLQQAIPKNHR